MALVDLTLLTWFRSICRILFTGLPLRGKSTGCLTLPHRLRDGKETTVWRKKIEGDLLYIVVPGEHGMSSILPEEDVHIKQWEFMESMDLKTRREVANAFHACLREAILGKLGNIHSLVIDGLSWWYPLMMPLLDWTDSDYADKESGKKYGRFHAEFMRTFSPIIASSIPVVAATAYLDREPSNPDDPKSFKTGLPALPGRMGRQDIFGVFPFVINCERDTDNQGNDKFWWRLAPSAKVQSAGCHVPLKLAKLFPKELPPDWREIEKIVGKGLQLDDKGNV